MAGSVQLYSYHGNQAFIEAVADRLVVAGFRPADEDASASIALTYCTTQAQLEELYFGQDGFVQLMEPGALLVDLSPTTPNFSRELGAVVTISDMIMVEAPLVIENMARKDSFAQENIRCLAAGEDGAVKQALPLLEALAHEVSDMGGLGSAQLARAALTLQTTALAMSTIEADALYRAVRRSVSSSGMALLEPHAISPQGESILEAVSSHSFDGAFSVEMLMAEITAALMAADDADLILPQAEAAMHLLELLAVIGGSDKSPAALALVYGEDSECLQYGLDWSRAEKVYGSDRNHANELGGSDEFDHGEDGFDEYGYDFDRYVGHGGGHGPTGSDDQDDSAGIDSYDEGDCEKADSSEKAASSSDGFHDGFVDDDPEAYEPYGDGYDEDFEGIDRSSFGGGFGYSAN